MNDLLNESLSVIQAIQLILAPAVMISACGLLTLGIGNKFSTVLNRIRLLNEEKRKLFSKAADKHFSLEENQRLVSIARQIQRLMQRAGYVRNSLVCYSIAIGLFVLTSLLIGVQFFFETIQVRQSILAIFLVGMVGVFCGVVFTILDAFKGYDIVKFEVEASE